MTRAAVVAFTSIVLGGAIPDVALSQPEKAPAATPEDQARVLFGEAKDLRAQGKWREACDKFKQAHETFPTGGTTFAMADCADREGDLPGARALYQKVLDDPSNKDNAERTTIANNRITEIDKELAAAKPAEPPKSEPKTLEKSGLPSVPAPDAPRKASLVPGAIVLGAGGAVLVVGGALGGVALAKANDVKAACKGNVCPSDQESPAKSAKNLALGADISFGVGAAAAIAGVIMMATMKQPAKDAVVEPTASGILVRF